jgi:hypothetical protein
MNGFNKDEVLEFESYKDLQFYEFSVKFTPPL